MNGLLSLLLFISFLSPLKARVFVASEEDFFIHMKNHVNNVKTVGKVVVQLFETDPHMPEYFEGLGKDFVLTPRLKKLTEDFLTLHDASKINIDPQFLDNYHLSEPGVKKLFPAYGKPFEQMSELEKNVISGPINGIDGEVRQQFMRTHNVSAQEMKFLDQVEKIADHTERGSNPVTSEEIGKKALHASDYYSTRDLSKAHSAEDISKIKGKIELARKLEDIYPKVATSYEQYKKDVLAFKKVIDKMGIAAENFREFSEVELFDHYIKGVSPGTKITTQSVAKFLFENEGEFSYLKSFALKASKESSMLNLDLARYFHLKHQGLANNPRYDHLFQTLAGECAH